MRRPLLFFVIAASVVGCNAILGIEGGNFDPSSTDASPETGTGTDAPANHADVANGDVSVPTDSPSGGDNDVSVPTDSGAPDADASVADADAAIADADADTGPACNTQSDPKNCGVCGHDCLQGACTAGVCQPWTVIDGNSASFTHLAVGPTDVYYTDNLSKRLLRAAKDGSDADGTSVHAAGANESISNLVWQDNFLYFVDDPNFNSPDPNIVRCDDTGCDDIAGPETVLDTTDFLTSFAFDSSGDLLATEGAPVTGSIYRCTTLPCVSPTTVVTNEPTPRNLVVNGNNLAWTVPGKIRIKVGTQDPVDGASSTFFAIGLSDTELFYSDTTVHTVFAAQLSNPVATRIVGSGLTAGSIATDATNLYFTEVSGKDVIERAVISGGKASPFVSNTSLPSVIAIDATAIYWVESSTLIRAVAK